MELSEEMDGAVGFPRSAVSPRGVRVVVVVQVAATLKAPSTTTVSTSTISVRCDLDRQHLQAPWNPSDVRTYGTVPPPSLGTSDIRQRYSNCGHGPHFGPGRDPMTHCHKDPLPA